MKEKLRAEWKKIQSIKGREKWEYIWGYYKIHIIATAAALLMTGSIVNDVFINPPPDSVLTIAWMGGFELEGRLDTLRNSLYPILVDDTANETVHILTFLLTGADPQQDMAQHTRFSAMTAARELDIVIGTLEHNEEVDIMALGMAPSWFFYDLRPFLAEAGIEPEGLVFHEDEEGTPIAFAIPLDGSVLLEEAGIATEGRWLGVIGNTQREEAVVKAIRALFIGS